MTSERCDGPRNGYLSRASYLRYAVRYSECGLSVSPERILGDGRAHVVLVTYSDFQCPYCGMAAREILPVLKKEYVDRGRLRIAFKNLPLSIHPLAPGAAAAAACAGQQRQFWPMHDRLFREPTRLLSSDLEDAATEIGVDRASFESCLSATKTAALVQEDMAEAARLGISSTPTFIIGRLDADGRVRATDVLSGAKPVEAFREILDRLLKG
jgi:protein-disulfide isomerase